MRAHEPALDLIATSCHHPIRPTCPFLLLSSLSFALLSCTHSISAFTPFSPPFFSSPPNPFSFFFPLPIVRPPSLPVLQSSAWQKALKRLGSSQDSQSGPQPRTSTSTSSTRMLWSRRTSPSMCRSYWLSKLSKAPLSMTDRVRQLD